jgi:hypothetical protein
MNRMIDTATWDDPWFAELEPDAKLVFLYLLTNRRSTAAGAFEITIRHMAFETGLDGARIDAILAELNPRVQWWPAHQVIWIRNFFRHQAANENFAKSARTYIDGLPVEIQRAIGSVYPDLVPEWVDSEEIDQNTGSDTHVEPVPMGSDTHIEPVPYPSASKSKENSSREGEKSAPDAPAPPKSKTNQATRLPSTFTLTDGRLAYAVEKGMDRKRAEYQFERLRNWADAHQVTRKDWDAQWRNWVLKDINENGPSATPDRPTAWKLNASGVMVEVPR